MAVHGILAAAMAVSDGYLDGYTGGYVDGYKGSYTDGYKGQYTGD